MPTSHAAINFSSLDIVELKELAFARAPSPSKALAIEALALRAIEVPDYRPAAVEAISEERMLRPRMGPALGWLGGAAVLSSDDSAFIGQLLDAMTSWSADEQRDLLRAFSGKGGLSDYLEKLSADYSWHPSSAL